MGQAGKPASFGSVWAVAEFRAVWAADVLSIAGDQLARVALALLVFTRTGSTALTALTYALTFVPALAGGILLGGMGDRFACRTVMVVVDVVRAILVVAMVVPGLPLWGLWTLVGALTFLAGPFKAAQQSCYPTCSRRRSSTLSGSPSARSPIKRRNWLVSPGAGRWSR